MLVFAFATQFDTEIEDVINSTINSLINSTQASVQNFQTSSSLIGLLFASLFMDGLLFLGFLVGRFYKLVASAILGSDSNCFDSDNNDSDNNDPAHQITRAQNHQQVSALVGTFFNVLILVQYFLLNPFRLKNHLLNWGRIPCTQFTASRDIDLFFRHSNLIAPNSGM